ncbi:MAG TPA: hypothetical protein VGB50_02525 [Flavobacterium sp.]|jgi:ABC-type phosphate/phosphonate transport system substrate-binding protein
MKKILLFPAMAGLFMLNVASTCSSDDDNSSSSQNTTEVVNTVSQGTWRVTSFVEDGDDHTNYFSNFTFTFAGSNVLTAVNGTTTYTGAWSVTNDHSGNDDDDSGHHSSNDVDFNIAFSAPNNFEELTEDWHILERTDTKIRLEHVSGGDGSIDTLTFEKN